MNNTLSINANNIRITNNKVMTSPNFRSNDITKTDVVEIQKKPSKGLSDTAKWGIGIGTVATIVGLGILLVKQTNKAHKKLVDNIEQLCDEKLKLSNLPEKIEWKAAKTLEEAVKFTKEALGIKEVDKNFTLEALNDTNACITDICNLHKGKLYMPTALEYTDRLNENMLACVYKDVHSKDFGKMSINKRYFDRDFLIKELKEDLYWENGEKRLSKNKDEYVARFESNGLHPYFDKNFTEYLDKYYNDSSKLSLDELRTIHTTLKHMNEAVRMPKNYPMTMLKDMQIEFEKNGIKISIEEFSKLSNQEQSKILIDSLRKLKEKGEYKFVKVRRNFPDETIYHEMGHLQDYGKNLKDLYMKTYNDFDLNAIADRFGSIMSNENMKKLWETDKEKFKKQFPNQYEFLTNQETQELAGKVSTYAKSGIGEFIAEYYAQMAEAKQYGGKMVEDVEALYKKYNGPIIN